MYNKKLRQMCKRRLRWSAEAGISKVGKLYVHYLRLSPDKMPKCSLSQKGEELYELMALYEVSPEVIVEILQL